MVLTATLQCDIVVIMDDKFSYTRTNQLRKGVIPISFNLCTCSDGILLSNSDLLFAKTLGWGKWIPASAGMTVWRKN
jgi:hypothetical protein